MPSEVIRHVQAIQDVKKSIDAQTKVLEALNRNIVEIGKHLMKDTKE
jgi:hypothetical protein